MACPVIGAVVGSVVAVSFCVTVIYYLRRKKKQQTEENNYHDAGRENSNSSLPDESQREPLSSSADPGNRDKNRSPKTMLKPVLEELSRFQTNDSEDHGILLKAVTQHNVE